VDGYSDFNALHSNRHDDEVELIAFDVLALGGDDLRKLPLSMRKSNLQRLLSRRPDSIFLSDFESGEIGPDLFRKACEFGLEGLVSKRADRPYRGGRSKDWIKVKNRQHHSVERVREAFKGRDGASFGEGVRGGVPGRRAGTSVPAIPSARHLAHLNVRRSSSSATIAIGHASHCAHFTKRCSGTTFIFIERRSACSVSSRAAV
jgi:hypothetical protein